MGEYIKAWFILHVIAKEFDLGAQDGFQFNISVGYDLAGIKEPKVNTFIDSMMEAKDTEIFKECKQWLLDNVDKFEKVTKRILRRFRLISVIPQQSLLSMDVLQTRLRALQIICLKRNT